MKPIAYIHIGLEKTGTTTLQEYFHINRDQLAQDKINYLKSPGHRNHTDLAAYAYDKTLGDLIVQKGLDTEESKKAFRDAFIQRFNTEINSVPKNNHLLVSSEHLSSRVFSKNEIRKLIRLFSNHGYQVKVIVYLRRQDQYLLSTYSTWLKCGATAELNKKAYKRKRYDYLTLLEMWEEVVGRENIIAKIFERRRMHNNDLIEDFMQILNTKTTADYSPVPSNLNKSLDMNKLLFLKLMNRIVPEAVDKQKNPLRGELISALEQMPNYDKLQLPAELSEEIIEYYKEDNLTIRKKYFPALEGNLFNDQIKKISNDKSGTSRLSREKLFDILGSLWKYQQKEINHLKETCSNQQMKIAELTRHDPA